MEVEQVQVLYKKVQQVRHALAGIISSLEMVMEEFDTLSPDFRNLFEDSWHKTCLQAIENLNQSCLYFEQGAQETKVSCINQALITENR